MDQPANVPLPPPTVPGLTGLSVLARGGYATVYRAVQESVGRDVAVKIENRTLESERDQRRFLREARAAGRMSSHPHVVDLFDAGVTQDRHPYLIMELCEGSYADRIKTMPLSPVEARDVGVKIADALADAHTLGVLHRDVKPANILMSRFGEPALADFGLAVLAETRDSSITLEVLTPAYAPLEMFRAGNPPSPAADVYSLCATLYALLRGRPPRWRDERNPSLVTLMDLFDQPIPDLPGAPRYLLDLLRSGMVNEAERRPSAALLRDQLAALALPAHSLMPVPVRGGPGGIPGPVGGPGAIVGPGANIGPGAVVGPGANVGPGGVVGPRGIGGPGGGQGPGSAAATVAIPISAPPVATPPGPQGPHPVSGAPVSGPPISGPPISGPPGPVGGPPGVAGVPPGLAGMPPGAGSSGYPHHPPVNWAVPVEPDATEPVATEPGVTEPVVTRPVVIDPVAPGPVSGRVASPPGRQPGEGHQQGQGQRAVRPGYGRPEPDPYATVPVRRWRVLAVGGAVVLVFGILVGGATWYGLAHRTPVPSSSVRPVADGKPPVSGPASPRASGRASPKASSRSGPTAVAGNCAISFLGGACPATPTCYGRLSVSGGAATAHSVSCTATHTWEVFAIGTLPAGLSTVDYQSVRGNDVVRGLCNSATLSIVSLQAILWQIDVLPPTLDAYNSGDRTFRCLAGKGPDSLHQPAFGH